MQAWRHPLALVPLFCACGRINFDAACPPSYTETPDGCYRFGGNNVNLTWLDAERECELDSGHLVVIDTMEEAAQVTALASPTFDNWFGASDRVVEGEYLDVLGAPMLGLAWLSGEPSGDDCIEIDDTLAVGDSDCTALNEFVCEYDGRPVEPAAF